MPRDREFILILTSRSEAVDELRRVLERAGYRLQVAESLGEVVKAEGGAGPAVVLLDRPHCGLDAVRSHWPSDPLFVSVWPMSGGCTEDQYVDDLEAGADDVISGQTPRQIVARVRALLRRRQNQRQPQAVLTAGPLRMDLDRHEVTVHGKVVTLTSKEFAILRCFLAAPGRVFSREDMLNRVWGEGYALEAHALDVHIHALRHKLEQNPSRPALIVTVRGVGYKLRAG